MSLYTRNITVPVARIGAYPKRRQFTVPEPLLSPIRAPRPVNAASGVGPDACYADFFRTSEEVLTASAAAMTAS